MYTRHSFGCRSMKRGLMVPKYGARLHTVRANIQRPNELRCRRIQARSVGPAAVVSVRVSQSDCGTSVATRAMRPETYRNLVRGSNEFIDDDGQPARGRDSPGRARAQARQLRDLWGGRAWRGLAGPRTPGWPGTSRVR